VNYAIAAFLVCNDKRIQCINVGGPSSVHDQKMYPNSVLSRNPGEYFSDKEYLSGD
jgi:hypothetical protein